MADQPFDPLFPAGRAPDRDDSSRQEDRKARLLWTQSRTFIIAARGPETALMSLPPSTAIDVFIQYRQPGEVPTITSPDGREVFNLYAGEQLMTRILTSFTPGGHTPGGGGNDLPAVGRIFAIRDFPADGWELKIDTTAMVPDPDAAPTLFIDVVCQGWAREPTGIGPRELETIVAGEEQTDSLVVAVATAGLSDVDVPAFALVPVFNLIDPWEPTNQDKAGAQDVIMCGVDPDLNIHPLAVNDEGGIFIDTEGLATEAKQDDEIAILETLATSAKQDDEIALLTSIEEPDLTGFTGALAGALVVVNSACRIKGATGRIDATAPTATYYVQLWNLAAAPADTTAYTTGNGGFYAPLKIVHSLNADDYFDIEIPDGFDASAGFTITLSSTEFTKSASPGNYLSATGIYKTPV
jgi:hypothetical protein